MCLIFTVFYGVSCLTKHSPNFYVLLFGRFLGGICTSILMSCFEAWLVHEHRARHHPEEWLGLTMAVTSQGNGIVAIVAGVLGQLANSQYVHTWPHLFLAARQLGYVVVGLCGYCCRFCCSLLDCLWIVLRAASRSHCIWLYFH